MLYAYVWRFDVTHTVQIFLESKQKPKIDASSCKATNFEKGTLYVRGIYYYITPPCPNFARCPIKRGGKWKSRSGSRPIRKRLDQRCHVVDRVAGTGACMHAFMQATRPARSIRWSLAVPRATRHDATNPSLNAMPYSSSDRPLLTPPRSV